MRDTINHRIHGCRGETQSSSAVTGVASDFGGTIRAKLQGAAGQLCPPMHLASAHQDDTQRARPPAGARVSVVMPSLDGIRALCIALVVGAHAAQSMGFPDRWKPIASDVFDGSLGVTVFFVLSGFLITFPLTNADALMIGAAAGIAYFERGAVLRTLLRFRLALLRGHSVVLMWMLMVVGHGAGGAITTVAFGGTATALAGRVSHFVVRVMLSYASCPRGTGLRHAQLAACGRAVVFPVYLATAVFNGYGLVRLCAHSRRPAVSDQCRRLVRRRRVSYHALEMPVLSLRTRFRPIGTRADASPYEPEGSTSPL